MIVHDHTETPSAITLKPASTIAEMRTGAYFQRLCARMDKAKAVTAAAHKLARLFYTLLTRGQEYVDQGQQYYEERYRQRVIYNLRRKATKLGMTLVATT